MLFLLFLDDNLSLLIRVGNVHIFNPIAVLSMPTRMPTNVGNA